MDKAKAKELYESSLAAGYSPERAKERTFKFLRTGEVEPDPTEAVWARTIKQESGGNQAAVSHKGATGIAQVMPSTGPEAAKLAGRSWDPIAFKENSGYNEAIGRAYLRKQIEDFGNVRHGLMAYNAGPGRVRKVLSGEATLPAETRHYVKVIAGDTPVAAENPRDKAKAVYAKMAAEGASADEIKAAVAKVMGKQLKASSFGVASTKVEPAPVEKTGAGQTIKGVGWQPAPGTKIDRLQAQVEEDMQGNFGSRMLAGAERSVLGNIQGARKLWNQLTGDDATVDDINEQNQRAKDFWAKADPEGTGVSAADLGRLGADIGTFAALPVGGAGAAGRVAAGVGVGGLQGVLAPTVEGDSQLGNAAIGGALGGTLPALGAGLGKLIGRPDPARHAAAELLRGRGVDVPRGLDYDSPLGRVVARGAGETGQDMSPAITAEIARLAGVPQLSNDVIENTTRSTGQAIGDLSAGLSATPGLPFAKAVNDLRTDYLRNGLNAKITDPVAQAADDLLGRASQGPIDGELAQALRSQLGSLATKGTAQEKTAYKGLQRALDDLMEPELAAAGKTGQKQALNSQYRMLKLLRSGQGIPADGITPRSLAGKIETAVNKGGVNDDLRSLLEASAQMAPRARLGAEINEDAARNLMDRPQGVVSALMRLVPSLLNPVMKSGAPQALVNSEAVGKATTETARNALLPILLRLNSGE